MNIGYRIKQRRIALNLSQEALAKRVNSQQQSVARWEMGENAPRRHTIRLLAEALQVSVIWLEFGGAEHSPHPWTGSAQPAPGAQPQIGVAQLAQSETQSPGSPVYSCSIEDSLHLLINSSEEIETGIPPKRHQSSPHIYGFYLPDDRMAPRFLAGELIWLHPQRPPKVGEEALAIPLKASPKRISAVLGTVILRANEACTFKIGSHEMTLSSADYSFHLIIGVDLGR